MKQPVQTSPTSSGVYAWEQSRAIIDIGSNTVRLVVYGGPPRAPVTLLNEKVTAKLGKHVAETGKLSQKAVAGVLAALARYKALIDLAGVPRVDVVATAAARDASNGAAFLERVRAIGFEPRLLSGVEEAETSATGVLGAFPEAEGIVGDLGGGSLELVDVAQGGSSHGVSLPLGSLRLPPLRAKGDRVFVREIGKLLAKADWVAEPGATLYLVGGPMRALARAMMVRLDWPFEDTHGFALDTGEALALARQLARRGQALKPIEGVATSRLSSIPDAAALLGVLLQRLQPGRVVFSSWGLREGVLFGSLDEAAQKQNPLLAGVMAFVAPMAVDVALVDAAVAWMAGVVPMARTPLGRAAVALCMAAGRVEPNVRRDLPGDWGLSKRWVGVDNAGRGVLAAALRGSVGKGPKVGVGPKAEFAPEPWARLASPAMLAEARGLGLAARLCRRLSAGSTAVIAATQLEAEGGALRLSSRVPQLVGDGSSRDLKELAQHLGLVVA
ncbi:MAG: exopolyphosphatase [Novosphingobium sp.]|uniref:Ppx/GppA phosphatase family protein n=1 Tax=Novosphingobium sp. TaxID=1874826 RepID=UPI0027340A63|nr:exopolyphosphatase [Novosphingobium sp.]MDP3549829.1 exopolyphosphatase [Novosphingobium sp.]